MSKISKILYFFISFCFLAFMDMYFTKLALTDGYKFSYNPVFDITFVQNQGAAFSLFEGFKAFLIAFSAVAVIGIVTYIIKRISKLSVMSLFCMSLLAAGISCNMGERIILGYVRDYIKLKFIDFPVFNISDIFINIAVICLIIIIAKNKFYKSKN